MCGFAGFLSLRSYGSQKHSADRLTEIARHMGDVMIHRGPDGSGIWTDHRVGLALSHRRLSIIDLSKAGRQPMVSGQGRMAISYNGEVYNANELRAELQNIGVAFQGHSDTEVILESCVQWGVVNTVQKLVGMFAFVL